ncbi:nuclear envelope pore membrane protein POM 121-like [Manis javanica]|uniref:nuclear envelope pore membrane protein POM 121-like n=1 Tax=Manis javanica TaxID=9974 RepID=UPI003C6D104B
MSVPAPHSISTTGVFSFGAGQSGSTGSTAPFLGGLSQNSLGAAGQSTPFPFHVAGTPQNMSVFAATTSGFGATTQTTSSGTSSSVFGSTISSPFTSKVSAGPAGSWGFGMSVDASHSSSTTGVFGFGAEQSGSTGGTAPWEA